MVMGVKENVDGRGIDIEVEEGGNVINGERMWKYKEGIRKWKKIWKNKGIRIMKGK